MRSGDTTEDRRSGKEEEEEKENEDKVKVRRKVRYGKAKHGKGSVDEENNKTHTEIMEKNTQQRTVQYNTCITHISLSQALTYGLHGCEL